MAWGTTSCFRSLIDRLEGFKKADCRIVVVFSSIWTRLCSFISFSHGGCFHKKNFLTVIIACILKRKKFMNKNRARAFSY